MRAVVVADGQVAVEDRRDPVPGPGEVLVRVRGAGLNGADMMQLRGFYPHPRASRPTSRGSSSLVRLLVWARGRPDSISETG